ncbi:MAG: 4Fe-4S binding protein [Bryobacterales bacterium]|nr:4Fe-4S binding protein [Bryobacterales bacterium]
MVSAPAPVLPDSPQEPAKQWERRTSRDRSQALRRTVQFAFLALNIWIGVEFYYFVRQFESGGAVFNVSRPPGVEGWLPIAGMMNTKFFLLTGQVPKVHPATMVLFIAFLLSSFVFRKAFCGWLCPVGTLSEYLWKFGRGTFRRVFFLPRWLDIGLRSLKYVLMGLFAYAVASMPPVAISEFLESPYGLVADVKMLDFFRYMGVGAAITIGILAIASIFVQNFWCRYLCPYGALQGLAALLSPLRITRVPDACIDCAKCAKACPSRLPVDVLVQIRSAECLGCMECVAVCPAEGALDMAVSRRWKVRPWVMAAGVVAIFVGIVAVARITGHWHSPIPNELYQELIPRVHEFSHP